MSQILPAKQIWNAVQKTVKQYQSSDPAVIVRDSPILLSYSEDLRQVLGLYFCRWKHRIIILNASLDTETERMVLAHELGHDALHRDIAKIKGLEETALFQMTSSAEYEANAFAAHLLIRNSDILEYVRDYRYDPWDIARDLHLDVQLVLVKIQEMNRMGFPLKLPEYHDSRFMRTLQSFHNDSVQISEAIR